MPLSFIDPPDTATFPTGQTRLEQLGRNLALRGDPLASATAPKQPEPSWGQTWRAGVGATWLQGAADTIIGHAGQYPAVEGFNPFTYIRETPALANDPTVMMMMERGQFDGDHSPDEFAYSLANGRRFLDDIDTMSRASTAKGLATMGGLMVGDPLNLIPLGWTLKGAKAAGTLARAGRIAAVAGTASLATEQLTGALQPVSDEPGWSNELFAAGAGAAFGASLGLLTSPAFVEAASTWIGTRKLTQLRKGMDEALGPGAVHRFDPNVHDASNPEGLVRTTLEAEIAAGKSHLEAALADEATDNRTVSALHRPGDENAGILEKLRAKYAAAGKPLHIIDHPDQWVYDLQAEARAIADSPDFNAPATPADLKAAGIDRAVSAITGAYAAAGSVVSPGGRLARAALSRIQDVYRTLSGSAQTITRGSARDPFSFPAGAAAESLKDVLDAVKDSAILELRGIYAAARRQGPAEMVYGSARIRARGDAEGFRRAVADLLRRENAQAAGYTVHIPENIPKPIRDGADAVRRYLARMRDEAEGVGLLEVGPRALKKAQADAAAIEKKLARVDERLGKAIDADAHDAIERLGKRLAELEDQKAATAERIAHIEQAIKGQAAYLPRAYNVEAILADRPGFIRRLIGGWQRRDRALPPDERPLRPEVLRTIMDRQPKPEAIEGAIPETAADPRLPVEQPFGRSTIERIIDRLRPGLLHQDRQGQRIRATNRRLVRMELDNDPDHYARLIGRVFEMAEDEKLHKAWTGGLRALDSGRLQVGDEFMVGDYPVVVSALDDGTLTLDFGSPTTDMAGIEVPNTNFARFTIRRGLLIPTNKGSLARLADEAPPAKFQVEGDLPPDLRAAYAAELEAFYRRNAEAAYDKLTHPQERHGIADTLPSADPIKARLMDIDEFDLAGFLEPDIESIVDRYARTMGGRIAVRRAIQLNENTWGRATLADGRKIQSGQDLIDYLDETVDTMRQWAAHLDTVAGRRPEDRGSSIPAIRRLARQIDRDIRAPLAVLEGRNPIGEGSGLYTAFGWLGRQLLRVSFANKLGSVAWAQLSDLAPISLFMMQRPTTTRLIPAAILNLKSLPKRDLETVGLMFDHLSRTRALAEIDDATSPRGFGSGIIRRATVAIDRGTEAVSDTAARITGMNFITNKNKQVAGGVVFDRVVELSRRLLRAQAMIDTGTARPAAMKAAKLSDYEAAWLNKMGVNVERARRLAENIYRHGLTHDDAPVSQSASLREFLEGTAHTRRPLKLNMADWPMDPTTPAGKANRDLYDILTAAIHGEVSRSLVVTPGAFDRPLINHTTLGRLFNQFQTFAAAFGNGRLAVMAQMPAKYQAWYSMAYMFMGAITDAISNDLSGRRSLDETAKLWGENPLGMSYQAFHRSGLAGWMGRPLAIADALGIPFSPGNLFNNTVGSTAAQHIQPGRALTMAGPVFADADRAIQTLAQVSQGNLDDRTAQTAWKLAPFQNLVWLRMLYRATGLPVVPEALNSPERQAQSAPP